MDLVKDLLLAGGRRDLPSRTWNLGDDNGPILADLANGKAQASQPRNVLVAGIGEVSARHLPGTFEKMPDQRGLAEPMPVVRGPAELMDERTDKEGGIGSPAGDDDV